jgi:ribosome biogenesis GTPase
LIDLKLYGYIETGKPAGGLLPGRVIEQRREQYTVLTEQGEVTALLKGAFLHEAVIRSDLPCVGDFVLLQYNESGVSLITGLLPRHSKFSRTDYSGHGYAHIKAYREQIIAVNFDYVFILSSLNQDYNVNRIMRYLMQAQQSGGQPVVLLTKADLVENYSNPLAEVKQIAADVPVHAVSSRTGLGLDELDEYLQPGKTVVFLGMSGVGKSSLLNILMNQEVMAVKTIREDDSRGRHTTTHRQLFKLPSGAMVIDTPGMRELGIIASDEEFNGGFADIEELFTQCRFSDCRHTAEPGCAVLDAVERGDIPQVRWKNYQKLKREALYTENKAAIILKKTTRNKNVAIWSRKIKK